ncbi:MAG: hypothetical protein M1831_001322 [Alyxoria varia]|nr:MAG: hypothetical protein M1831_001322 [Alyxoria varia]
MLSITNLFCLIFSLLLNTAGQQAPLPSTQSNAWQALPGSEFYSKITDTITRSGVHQNTAESARVAASFEWSNWATGSVFTDPFYRLPDNAANARPGDLLKSETTNVSQYTVPPALALSRFIYQTQNLNGSSLPASGFVLWPYLPRRFDGINGIPAIAWGHGTSGSPAECAPSHIQNLWYQWDAPFPLALQGYAVIAPDFGGLGISKNATGQPILHQWGASPSQANDLFYAVEAARKAWPQLAQEFVVMGHSQSGGAAWAAAERQVKRPVAGYLGTVAVSPLTGIPPFGSLRTEVNGAALPFLVRTAESVFSGFEASEWLTTTGQQLTDLYYNLQGCMSTFTEVVLPSAAKIGKAGWEKSWHLSALNKLSAVGMKPFVGPLLVIQGTGDGSIDVDKVSEVVRRTCEIVRDADLSYVTFEGPDHVPTLYASQTMWLKWIEDRFNGKTASLICQNKRASAAMPYDVYQKALKFFLMWPLYAYEMA